MANIHLNGSGNPHINMSDPSMPKYIGAEVEATRVENGVRLWTKDYKGETEAVVYDGQSGVAVVEYGVTPFSEICDAIANGKKVVCKKDHNYYDLEYVLNGGSPVLRNVVFTRAHRTNTALFIYEVKCVYDNTWSNHETRVGIHISTEDPTSADGLDGDIWIKYTTAE